MRLSKTSVLVGGDLMAFRTFVGPSSGRMHPQIGLCSVQPCGLLFVQVLRYNCWSEPSDLSIIIYNFLAISIIDHKLSHCTGRIRVTVTDMMSAGDICAMH